MPHQTPDDDVTSASMLPTEINLQCIEDDVHLDLDTNQQNHKRQYFFYGNSDAMCEDDIPSSQDSVHSQGFGVGSDSQSYVSQQSPQHTSNQNDDHTEDSIDLFHLMRNIGNSHETDNGFYPNVPRNKTPTVDILKTDSSNDLMEINQVTPTKPSVEVDPLTPTANLKMLISAASPEIRNREKLKEQCKYRKAEEKKNTESTKQKSAAKHKEKTKYKSQCNSDTILGAEADIWTTDGMQAVSRKEKSLGLLCQKFLAKYPEYPGPFQREEICLDEVAKELVVERRRIYDIVNVLESVEMVSRLAKNRYTWHGKTNLQETLTKLKLLAEQEGYADQIGKVNCFEVSNDVDNDSLSTSPCKRVPLKYKDDINIPKDGNLTDYFRRNRSLGIMSQKFLMLFLVSQNRAINLDLAAKIIIGDPTVDRTENAKFKTKIRRLYDIANILTSLDLIRKVHVTQLKGRKPAFKYIGPDVQQASHIQVCASDGFHRPSSRHSLLDCVQNPQVCTMLNSNKPSITDHQSKPTGKGLVECPVVKGLTERPVVKKPFSRHASLDQICEVAEEERKRLYFDSKSQPSSPTKTKRVLLPKTKSMTLPRNHQKSRPAGASDGPVTSDSKLKHILFIRNKAKLVEEGSNKPGAEVFVQRFPRETSPKAADNDPAGTMTPESLLLRAQVVQPAEANKRQPTILRLSKEQLESMVSKLNVVSYEGSATQQVTQVPVVFTSPSVSQSSGLVSLIHSSNSSSSGSTRPVPKVHLLRMPSFPPPQMQEGHGPTAQERILLRGPERKRSAKEVLPETGSECYFESKRPRIPDVSTANTSGSSQDDELSGFTQNSRADEVSRPSPRILHLDPEFRASPRFGEKTPSPGYGASMVLKVTEQLASPLSLTLSSKTVSPEISVSPVGSPPVQAVHTQPLMQISNTSSPVMLLPSQLVPISQESFNCSPATSRPLSATLTSCDMVQAPPRYKQPAEGTKLKLSSSGIAALGAIDTTPTLGHTLFSPSMMSPVSLGFDPMGIPQGNIAFRAVSEVQPSSNAIINLIPHLSTSPGTMETIDVLADTVSHLPLNLSARQQISVCSPNSISTSSIALPGVSMTHNTSLSSANLLLTPQNHILSPYDVVTPTQNVRTSSRTPATPSSFFRSTPGGFYMMNSIHSSVVDQTVSAFQPLGAKTNFLQNINISSTTARRLSLVECDHTP